MLNAAVRSSMSWVHYPRGAGLFLCSRHMEIFAVPEHTTSQVLFPPPGAFPLASLHFFTAQIKRSLSLEKLLDSISFLCVTQVPSLISYASILLFVYISVTPHGRLCLYIGVHQGQRFNPIMDLAITL